MISRRFSFAAAVVLPLSLVAMCAVAWWVEVAPAHAAVAWNSTTVPITGIVSGQPESVTFSGQVQIKSRLSVDPDAASRSKILLQIEFAGVSGVGSSTLASYVVESTEIVFRGLVPSDEIQLTFPFHPSNSRAVTSSRTGVASFALDFDTTTGVVTAARASISSPSF